MGVVRRDDGRTHRAARRLAQVRRHPQRADVDDEHRRVHVERRGRPPVGLISRPRARTARSGKTLATLKRMDRSLGGQYWNWYDHRTGESSRTGRRTRWRRSSIGCRRWTTAGWPSACASSRTACRNCHGRAGDLFDGMDFGVYYVPERNLVRFHIVPGDPAIPPAVTTPPSARAGSSTTSASRAASCGRRRTSSAGGRSPIVRLHLAGDEARSAQIAILRRQGLRGRASVPLTRSSCPRGAEACSRRRWSTLFVPESQWAPQQLGPQPPPHRSRADPPRPGRRRIRLLGLLAGQRPRGWLCGVRRGCGRARPEREPVQ